MRNRYVILALSALSIAAMLFCWQRTIHRESSAAVAPYLAHLTITINRVLPDGSLWNAVSTEVRARDRQGRLYEKTGHAFQDGEQRTEWFSFLVQDPAKRQTLTWDSKSQAAVLGHWPYWQERTGCWTDEQGQHRWRFATEEDRHKIPVSPEEGKLKTMGTIADPTGEKRSKARFELENLGQKEMHGLTAWGMRTTTTELESGGASALPETTTEIWKSKEYDLTVLKLTSGPKYGSERMELTDLRQEDPDPALFEPPQGYTVETIAYHQVTCGQK
jgi:hypothetical protein